MQKKVIALAIAGLVSGAAFAQSNVTVYGAADAYYGYSKGKDLKFSGVNSGGWNGSRIGFKGEEALGNGLKAIFTIEFGTDIDANTSITQTRQSFVGLAGNFGSVTLGRQYSPSGSWMGQIAPSDITTVYPSNMFTGQFTTMQTGGGSRWNNSISYNSPVMSGLEARAIYSFGEKVGVTQDTTDAGKLGLGLKYANGPIGAVAMFQTVAKDDAVVGSKSNDAYSLGGNYDFKVVKVFGGFTYEKDKTTSLKKKMITAGVMVPVSATGSVFVEYANYKKDYYNATADAKSSGFGVGYNHDFSKRTRLYTAVSRINNADAIALGGIGGTASNDQNNTNFAVGIRHFF